MSENSPIEYLTPKQVAKKLSKHEETILRWCKKPSNPLKAVKLEGRWYIPPESIKIWAKVVV